MRFLRKIEGTERRIRNAMGVPAQNGREDKTTRDTLYEAIKKIKRPQKRMELY